MNKAVILLSGGLDSTTLLHYAARRLGFGELHALTFLYGQKHAREIECAEWQAESLPVAEHRVLDLAMLGNLTAGASALTDPGLPVPDLNELRPEQRDQPPTYVPNRNMILLALAAAYAESQGIATVLYGAQAQDRYGYWDCTPEFLERLNATLALNHRQAVRVEAPFMRMSKREVLALGLDMGVDYSRTWTCYRGQAKACGSCPACVGRLEAFRGLHVRDPVEYATPSPSIPNAAS
jgi:7-cyano-7-deazaguanine synthase